MTIFYGVFAPFSDPYPADFPSRLPNPRWPFRTMMPTACCALWPPSARWNWTRALGEMHQILRRSTRGSPEKTPPKNRPKKAGHIHQSLAYFKHILATLSHDPLEGDPQRIHRGWLGRRVHSAMGPWSSLQGSLGDFETPMAGQSHHLEANC